HIAKFEDLNGRIVAVATGGSSEPELKHIIETNKLNVRVINVDDHAAGLIAVESRRADAYFNDNAAFFSLIKQSKNGANLAVVGPEYGYSPQGFMVPKNNPTFLWIVNHAMGKMFKSGEAEKIFDKWFGPFGAKVSPKLRAAGETASYPEGRGGRELHRGLGDSSPRALLGMALVRPRLDPRDQPRQLDHRPRRRHRRGRCADPASAVSSGHRERLHPGVPQRPAAGPALSLV